MALFRCLIVLHLDSVGGCIYICIYSATTLKRINFMLYALSTFPRFMRLATNLAELK